MTPITVTLTCVDIARASSDEALKQHALDILRERGADVRSGTITCYTTDTGAVRVTWTPTPDPAPADSEGGEVD